MSFDITPEEAQPIALAVSEYYKCSGFKVVFERPLEANAPYRTTVFVEKSSKSTKTLVEAQQEPEYHQPFRQFVLWLRANRHNVEVYLATFEDSKLSMKTIDLLKEDGVGILIVNGDDVREHAPALNPALTVTIHPDIRLGGYRERVHLAVTDFNSGNRKGALQEMCELVEGATTSLLCKAAKKGWVNISPEVAEGMKFSDCINSLASSKAMTTGKSPIVSENFKNDLHSFRGARNLVDHPAKNPTISRKRTQQFTERMVMGPRLLAELNSLSRKVK